MGRASRQKKERKNGVMGYPILVEEGGKKLVKNKAEVFDNNRNSRLPMLSDTESVKSSIKKSSGVLKKAEFPYKGIAVYRSFDNPDYADDLVAGNLWISTLSTCRKYEDPLQGDSDEATHRYSSGLVTGGTDDTGFVKIAERAGIFIGQGCSDISLENCNSVVKIEDAFVLCTSEESSPELSSETFGKYCVEILEPSNFFMAINKAMEKDPRFKIMKAAWGPILYRDRSYTGLQDPPGPIGFVKPIKYQHQKEIRFIWAVLGMMEYVPFPIYVPELKKLCRRIA